MTLFNYSAVTKQLLILAKWLALASLVGLLAGAASALFLFSLDWVTHWREAYGAIIWLLPLAGFAVGWIYLKFGSGVEAGNNLLIDEIHDPQQVVPILMVLYPHMELHLQALEGDPTRINEFKEFESQLGSLQDRHLASAWRTPRRP